MLCILFQLRQETSVLSTVYLVPYFPHFCAFYLLFKLILKCGAEVLYSVPKLKKAVIPFVEEIHILDKYS